MYVSPDVVALRTFYASPIGQCVRRDISAAIAHHFQHISHSALMGIGFSLPYLHGFLETARQVLPLMFPHIGAMYWPLDKDNHTILCAEAELPLADSSIHYALICHSAEHSPHLATLMNELFRVLVAGGRALFIVPNRRGIWSSRTNNPFGFGHPYHMAQLRHRAELAGFTFVSARSALFYPPSTNRVVLRLSRVIERMGRLLLPHQGGILIMEVEKQLYATIPEPARRSIIPARLYPTAQATVSKNK
jgi:SAM-dependent methyltransferase